MHKLRIALITTWYPPNNGVAVNRMHAFVKYLPSEYDITVFTLGQEEITEQLDGAKVHYQKSKSLLNSVKHYSSDGKMKHNLKTAIRLALLKMGVTELKSWEKKTRAKLEADHQQQPFDLIISSYAPIEAHQVVYQFQKKNRLPWIADMRDEISSNPFNTERLKKELRKKELQIAPYIDAITTVSEPIKEDFKQLFPQVKYVEEIRNGFDHDLELNHSFNDRFTFVYAGTFYGKNKPDLFFKALIALTESGKMESDFVIKFVGTNRNFWIPKEFQENVEFIQRVPQVESMKYMIHADCNLLLSSPLGTMGRFTGKLFDYLSVEKPILALVDTEDVAAKLIEEHKSGVAVDFYDQAQIEMGILRVYEAWKKRESFPIESKKTQELHRRHQVKKLNDLIVKMIEK